MQIVRCISCDGIGWFQDDFAGEQDASDGVIDCDWCGGVGYTYRDAGGVDHRIPTADLEALSAQLEALETERMREMGYSGQAKKPWQQDIRKGTQGGQNPYDN